MKTVFRLLTAVVLSVFTAGAQACLWDSETMAVEQKRFPEALDVLTGKFPRHSARFHEWRMEQSAKALKKNPDQPSVYNDLAVSQHKLGKHREAIATMEAKERVAPGLYETWSNLGTFRIYTGELEEAVACIDKALKINPDAHFGREKYQRWLVLWVLQRREKSSPTLKGSAAMESEHERYNARGFADFILRQRQSKNMVWDETDRAPALKGILGMMRFADFDNPLLQEALGDVLISGDWDGNSATNAAFAYRIATTKATEPGEKQRLFSEFTNACTPLGEKWTPKKVAETLKTLLAEGTELQEKVRRDENSWLAGRRDVAAEFNKKYLKGAEAAE